MEDSCFINDSNDYKQTSILSYNKECEETSWLFIKQYNDPSQFEYGMMSSDKAIEEDNKLFKWRLKNLKKNLGLAKSFGMRYIFSTDVIIPLLLCTVLLLSFLSSSLLISLVVLNASTNNKKEQHEEMRCSQAFINVSNHYSIKQDLLKQSRIADQLISAFRPHYIRDNIRWLSEKMHIAGTVENTEVISKLATRYRRYGYDVKTYEYNVLLDYPDFEKPNLIEWMKSSEWEEISNGLGDPLGPPEALRQQMDPRNRVYWTAYAKNGTAEGFIVYVNYCTNDDFATIEKLGVSLNRKIILCRYGGIFRGSKVQIAERKGAAGVILYSDPFDYAKDVNHGKIYPEQIWLPPSGAQRGTLLEREGDPETPLFPSKPYTYRTENEKSLRNKRILPNIPVTSIGYRDAIKIMAKLDGFHVKQLGWKGGMNVTYRVTGSALFRLSVHSKTVHRNITNVIATLKGAEEPDRYVLLSNHVDAWVQGSIDPSSATGTLLEIARVLGETVKETSWHPRRTVMFCQWDAEEFGLMGSTEWVEEFMRVLQQRAVAVVNVDNISGNTTLSLKAVPLLYRAIVDAASKIPSPSLSEVLVGRETLLDSWKFYSSKGSMPGDKSIPSIGVPGFGSDFQRFISYLGIPVVDVKFENAPVYSYMLYHTMYEIPWTIENLMDRNFEALTAVGRFWLELCRNLADSIIIPFNVHDYAVMIDIYIEKINQYIIDTDIVKIIGSSAYSNIIYNLKDAAKRFQAVAKVVHTIVHSVNSGHESINVKQLEMLNSRLMHLEKSFINERGVYSNRPEYRHVVFSSTRLDEHGGVVLAALMEPVTRLRSAIARNDSRERDKLIGDIKSAFTSLQYCIESAILSLNLEGFYD